MKDKTAATEKRGQRMPEKTLIGLEKRPGTISEFT